MNDMAFQDGESAEAFAAVASEVAYDDLPEAAVEAAKKSIIDTVAVMAAAAGSTAVVNNAARLAESAGGKPEATIIGRSTRASAAMAAFANGCLAHALDYDDIEFESVYHPSGALVPAALAVAERSGWVHGQDFITAIVIGQDLGIRLARAIPLQRRPPWHRSVVISTFAAAATSARLMGLGRDGVIDALGHALNQAAGSLELRWGADSDVGGLYCGYSAKAGVFAALMAEAGIPGVRRVFDGQAGFFNLYFEGKCDRARLLGDLGKHFTGADTAYKPWAACAAVNTYVLAMLNAMKHYGFRADHIARVELHVGDYAVRNCEPLAVRQRPGTATDAKFSLPYTVAAAAVHGDLSAQRFLPGALRDKGVLDLAKKIVPVIDGAYDIKDGMPPGAITVHLLDGRVIHRREDVPYGHPSNPVGWEHLEAKARECFGMSRAGISADRAEEIVRTCRRMAEIADLNDFYGLLRPS